LIEVRWHGRGGQGVVTSSELLAKAALLEGKYVQHFPEFGPERRGAPVRAFTRISETPIDAHYSVYTPNIVVVIDPTLLTEHKLIFDGVKEGVKVIVNAPEIDEKLAAKVKELGIELYYVDAYKIALDVFGAPFYNTPMLGALASATGLVSLDSVKQVIKERFSGSIAEKNLVAVEKSAKEVKKYE